MPVESTMPPATAGYFLFAPGRPEADDQKEIVAQHGVTMDNKGWWFRDDLKKKTTRPRSKLKEREIMLHCLRSGDTLVVADARCLGLTEADVKWFLGEMERIGVKVVVGDGSLTIEPGDDTAEIAKKIELAQKALHQRTWRNRKSK